VKPLIVLSETAAPGVGDVSGVAGGGTCPVPVGRVVAVEAALERLEAAEEREEAELDKDAAGEPPLDAVGPACGP
jgi:hypothetical protein